MVRDKGPGDDVDAFLRRKFRGEMMRTDCRLRLPVDGAMAARREGGALVDYSNAYE